MSFYHTYRPQKFADLLGQDQARMIITEALKAQRLGHAYLFCGTRGTGKTSTARLLAKAINCELYRQKLSDTPISDIEPCNDCAICRSIIAGNCLDVIEIDAASNRGIDEIRQLQEQTRFKPQIGYRKIFIIDEVHMLTKEAFNALLKTLEEPPEHLIFILATTEVHKLPLTIISRCQRFDFMTPSLETLQQYLERMAKAEKIKLQPEAATQLARLAKGSFRDSATLLEQLGAGQKEVTLTQVLSVLGLPDDQLVLDFLGYLSDNPVSDLGAKLQDYLGRGGNPTAFIDRCFTVLQEQLLAGGSIISRPAEVLNQLLILKQQVKVSPLPTLPLTIAATDRSGLIRTTPIAKTGMVSDTLAPAAIKKVAPLPPVAAQAPLAPVAKNEELKQPSAAAEAPSMPPVLVMTEAVAAATETVKVSVAEQVPPAELPSGDLTDRWQTALTKLLEDSQSSLVSILRTAQPLAWDPPSLRIGVQFKFHADQLVKQKNRDILEAVFAEVLGVGVRIDPEVVPTTDLAAVAEEMF